MKAIITDFDGTLFDTQFANFEAYRRSFRDAGLSKLFGVRFDVLMKELCVPLELQEYIKERKAKHYEDLVKENFIKPNTQLLDFIEYEHSNGTKTAIASTARLKNIQTVLKHFHKENLFDAIISGEEVKHPKPLQDAYIKALVQLKVNATDAIAFEDTKIGVIAANHAGIKCIKIAIE